MQGNMNKNVGIKMDELIDRVNHSLDMGRNRFQWYTITRNEKHMIECNEWINIAQIYMKEIQNAETCKD